MQLTHVIAWLALAHPKQGQPLAFFARVLFCPKKLTRLTHIQELIANTHPTAGTTEHRAMSLVGGAHLMEGACDDDESGDPKTPDGAIGMPHVACPTEEQ